MKINIPEEIRLVAPRWTKKIETRKTIEELEEKCTIDGRELDIAHFRCCIVGESLNLFDKDYLKFSSEHHGRKDIDVLYHDGCETCMKFSMSFYHIITWYEKPKKLQSELNKYAKHLRTKKHTKLLEEKRNEN